MPMKKSKTRDMVLVALFTVLVIVGAYIKVPIPYVPFTLQVTFVTLAGMLLGARLGSLSCLLYMVIGLIGIPVFTQGGGIWYVLQPTFGYIIGFIPGAYVCGMISRRGADAIHPSYARLLAGYFAGLVIIYAIGVLWLYGIKDIYLAQNVGIWNILVIGLFTTLPGDAAMGFISCYVAKRLIPLLDGRKKSSPTKLATE